MLEPGNEDNTAALIAQAMPWIDSRLAAHGIARTGPPGEPRVRTWATVIPMTTDHGTTWFKAASGVTAHEIGLYPMLVKAAPSLVLHPIAIDAERAWILLPDGGTSLRHTVSGDALVDRLVAMVPHYAMLQREMASYVPAMLELGVKDMRPEALPQRFEEAMSMAEAMARDFSTRDDVDAMRRVRRLQPRFIAWVEELVDASIKPSIDHSDLHTNNILLPQGPGGGMKVYDWGDSVVAHPFSSLLVMLRTLMDQLEAGPDDPRLDRVRTAYLEPFTHIAPRADLLRLAEAACWTGAVIRALTWIEVLKLGPPENPDWATAPVEWMKTFLRTSWFQ